MEPPRTTTVHCQGNSFSWTKSLWFESSSLRIMYPKFNQAFDARLAHRCCKENLRGSQHCCIQIGVSLSPRLGEVAIDVARHAPQTGGWTALLAPRFCLRSLQTPRQRENRRVSKHHPHLHIERVREGASPTRDGGIESQANQRILRFGHGDEGVFAQPISSASASEVELVAKFSAEVRVRGY